VGAAIVVSLAVTLRRVETTFDVTASTELAEVTADSFAMPEWELDSAAFVRARGDRVVTASVRLRFAPGARIRVERVSTGPLRIAVEAPAGSTLAAMLLNPDGTPGGPVGRRFEFAVPDPGERARRGRTTVFSFVGAITLGQPNAAETGRAMVRSGTISMLGRTLLGSNRFEAGTARLGVGDRFVVDRPSGPAFGFVRVDEGPGLTAAYRILAVSGSVKRFGTSGYQVSTSLRDRLLKDHVLQGVWLTTVMLVGFATRVGKRMRGV
jgi:hypothetical protein